jgi:hypothetical protein
MDLYKNIHKNCYFCHRHFEYELIVVFCIKRLPVSMSLCELKINFVDIFFRVLNQLADIKGLIFAARPIT